MRLTTQYHRMKPAICQRLLLGVTAALFTSCTAPKLPTRQPTTEIKSLHEKPGQKAGTLSLPALQSEVMRFSDQYASAVAQAADDFRQRLPTPEARLAAQNWKLYQSTAAFINAANASPLVNALDMVVLATLARTVQEDYWVGQAFGDAARPMLETHRKLETEAWVIAEKMLKPAQQQELRELITEWRAKNPNQHYVAQRRLRDFAEAVGRLPPEGRTKPGCIFSLFMVDPLAGLDPTVRAVEQARYLAERSAYYLQRLPTLLSWQAELLTYQLAATPEVKQALSDTERLTKSTEVFAKTAEQLPKLVNDQREAAIKQLLDGLATERTKLIATLAADDMKLRTTLAELRQTLDAGNELAKSADATVKSVDTLMARFDKGTNAPAVTATNARPFDILDYAATAKEFTTTIKELNATVNSLDKAVPQIQKAGETFENTGNRLLNRLFLVGAGLVVILVTGALAMALV